MENANQRQRSSVIYRINSRIRFQCIMKMGDIRNGLVLKCIPYDSISATIDEIYLMFVDEHRV